MVTEEVAPDGFVAIHGVVHARDTLHNVHERFSVSHGGENKGGRERREKGGATVVVNTTGGRRKTNEP